MNALRSHCKKCGTPFDEANTGWKHNSGGTIARYCRHCNEMNRRRWRDNHPDAYHARPPIVRIPEPHETFFVHTPREIQTCDCKPWEGSACAECEAMWRLAIEATADWAVAS